MSAKKLLAISLDLFRKEKFVPLLILILHSPFLSVLLIFFFAFLVTTNKKHTFKFFYIFFLFLFFYFRIQQIKNINFIYLSLFIFPFFSLDNIHFPYIIFMSQTRSTSLFQSQNFKWLELIFFWCSLFVEHLFFFIFHIFSFHISVWRMKYNLALMMIL